MGKGPEEPDSGNLTSATLWSFPILGFQSADLDLAGVSVMATCSTESDLSPLEDNVSGGLTHHMGRSSW